LAVAAVAPESPPLLPPPSEQPVEDDQWQALAQRVVVPVAPAEEAVVPVAPAEEAVACRVIAPFVWTVPPDYVQPYNRTTLRTFWSELGRRLRVVAGPRVARQHGEAVDAVPIASGDMDDRREEAMEACSTPPALPDVDGHEAPVAIGLAVARPPSEMLMESGADGAWAVAPLPEVNHGTLEAYRRDQYVRCSQQKELGGMLCALPSQLSHEGVAQLIEPVESTKTVVSDIRASDNVLTLGAALQTAKRLKVPPQRVMRSTVTLAFAFMLVLFMIYTP